MPFFLGNNSAWLSLAMAGRSLNRHVEDDELWLMFYFFKGKGKPGWVEGITSCLPVRNFPDNGL